MFNSAIKIIGIGLLIGFTWVGTAEAQTPVSPQKKVLIKELLELTNAKNNAELMMQQSLLSMEAELPKLVAGMLANSGVEGDALKKQASDLALRISKRYRERFPQVINLSQVTEEITYSVYSKFYTEDELKDMISFFKTPTGKKTITLAPKVMAESMQLSNQMILPKVVQLIQEIAKDEITKVPAGTKK
jgi:hypothetical protein